MYKKIVKKFLLLSCYISSIHATQIQLKIKKRDENTLSIQVEPDISVSNLKKKIEALENIPLTRQRLIYKGMELNNYCTIKSKYKIKDGDTLHLMMRKPSAVPPDQTMQAPLFNNSINPTYLWAGGIPCIIVMVICLGAMDQENQNKQHLKSKRYIPKRKLKPSVDGNNL